MNQDWQIDESVLRFTTARWQKVAMVVAKVMLDSHSGMSDVNDHVVADRVKALIVEGRIECRGGLDNMRSSEIRSVGSE